ncbi:uncharacterized protein PG986_014125 [Apiospora aurea]|uniref:Uncharacterized protein n=1 Tax=Apiospora aurea TaxID=335848 RepID=A0ABR1PSE0_9PEZI
MVAAKARLRSFIWPMVTNIMLWAVSWPYYWTLNHFTIIPIKRMVGTQHDDARFQKEANMFLRGKSHELKFVTLASTLAAAANVGALSWDSTDGSTWVVFASWYFSLVLSILSLITAGQHSAVLYTLLGPGSEMSSQHVRRQTLLRLTTTTTITGKGSDDRNNETLSPSLRMIYIFQTPVMKMAWSVVMFNLGLILHVTSPLRQDSPGARDPRTGIFVLVAGGVATVNFGWCSFWLYRAAKYRDDDLEEACEGEAVPERTRPGV